MSRPEILFIVPARGGSKGIPRKNLVPLAGRPLMAHVLAAIQSARAALSDVPMRVTVSTDDSEIAAVARQWNAEIPALRPAELARDDSPSPDAVLHMMDVLERDGYRPTGIAMLQPTSPLVAPADIVQAVQLFLKDLQPVVSVLENEHPLEWSYALEENILCPLVDPAKWPRRRQDARRTFRLNGAIFIATAGQLRTTRSFLSSRPLAVIMPKERSIDIDSRVDLLMAETLLNQR